MYQPEDLKKDEPLLWSNGRGTDVWQMFCACVTGDLPAIHRLLEKDPSLLRCNYHYRTPIYFAVRENQLAAAALLLSRGADPLSLAVNDTLLEITRDRGYREMEELLQSNLTTVQNASSRGEPAAAAIRDRNLEQLRQILDGDPGLLHVGDQRGNQPIHWAVMTRQPEFIDEVLERGADINARRFDGAHPIQLVNGDYHYRGWRDVPKEITAKPGEVLDYLRARGAYVDICTAAYIGDINRVRELLAEDPSSANRGPEYITYYLGSGTPLKNAAARGQSEIVKLLLAHGADPNLPEEGIAPKGHALYSAVYNRHYEIAKLLLEHGAYPSPPVESSADALSIAISNKDEKMIELLCAHGSAQSVDLLSHYGELRTAAAVFAANPTLADDIVAFQSAAGAGNEPFVRLMLKHRPDLPKRTAFGAKTRELNELLFQHGMDPNMPDWLGATPLHHFANRGDIDKAQLFLDHGAKLDPRDDDLCSTPLGWAAKFGRVEMVQFLLDKGAKPNLRDDPPWATPLSWATRRGHTEVAELLKRHEAR